MKKFTQAFSSDNDFDQKARQKRIRRGDTRTRSKPRGFEKESDDPNRRGGGLRNERSGGFGGPRNDDRREARNEPSGGFGGPRNDDRREGRNERSGGFGGPRNDDRREGREGQHKEFRGPRNPEGRGNDDRGRYADSRRDDRNQGRRDDRNQGRRPQGDGRSGQFKKRGRRESSTELRPRDNARDVAAFVLQRVIDDDAFSNMALRTALQDFPMERRERAFATRLVYGTLTWKGQIDAVLNVMLPDGLHSLPAETASHLRVAMFQLLKDGEQTPVHAVIDSCVELVGRDYKHLRGVANGVLREFERQKDRVLAEVAQSKKTETQYGLPPHIAHALRKRLDEPQADKVMRAWNGTTPVHIRVRGARRNTMLDILAQEEHVRVFPHPTAPDAITVEGDIRQAIRPPDTIVQDAGAQLVCLTLPPGLDGLVADVCAGVGGKSLHLLDAMPDIDLVACDINKKKIDRIRADENEDRLSRIAGDMSTTDGIEKLALHAASTGHEDGFSAILIDAPCSALGTLGRHPEVRWKRTQNDVQDLAKTQLKLLQQCAQLIRPGGYLVYVVCTFTEEETLTQVDRFMQAHPDFIVSPPSHNSADPRVDWASLVDDTHTISLWPEPHETDGFFIVRFQRQSVFDNE